MSQQTPSTQKPVGQSAGRLHRLKPSLTVGVPGVVVVPPSDGALHLPVAALHDCETQSSGEVHAFLHDLPSAAHSRPSGQGATVLGTHFSLLPEQWPGVVSIEPAQVDVPQFVLLGLNPHAPVLQTSAHSPAAHFPCGSAIPSTATHVPSLPVLLHALHATSQASLQQTESATKPEPHCFPSVDDAPSGFLSTHLLVDVSQYFALTQSASMAQLVLQLVTPQV